MNPNRKTSSLQLLEDLHLIPTPMNAPLTPRLPTKSTFPFDAKKH